MAILLGQYKGIEVSITPIKCTDAMVEEQLAAFVQDQAMLQDKTPAEEGTAVSAELGDVAVIDFEGFLNGTAFKGGKGENYPLELGSGSFIPGFEEQVVGMTIGETKDIHVTFPEQYQAQELAGKAVIFTVKVNAIQVKKVPTLDDEFVAGLKIPDVETPEDLKEFIGGFLQQQVDLQNHDQIQQACENVLVKTSSCLLDPQAVEEMLQSQIRRVTMELQQQGINLDTYFKMTNSNLGALRKSLRPEAEKQAKLDQIYTEIAIKERLQVTQDEMNAQYERIAQSYQQPVEAIKNAIPSAALRRDLQRLKAAELVVKSAVVTENQPSQI